MSVNENWKNFTLNNRKGSGIDQSEAFDAKTRLVREQESMLDSEDLTQTRSMASTVY